MWYVVQTRTGDEQLVVDLFKSIADSDRYTECFIPLYEDVRKRDGKGRILIHRFFPGYFFVDTDDPDYVHDVLRGIPEFARVLGSKEKDGDLFIPVDAQDEEFLRTLLKDGIMCVSYIKRAMSGRIERLIGPLDKYANRIVKLDIPRRRAFVEIELFGKLRRFKFGLWTDADPPIFWITERLDDNGGQDVPLTDDIYIGVHPGDRVVDTSGVYEDQVFTVLDVDVRHRIIHTTIDMLGTRARLTLSADDVKVI